MIYITGDVHIPHDIHKLSNRSLLHQYGKLTTDDYVIICGDFGIPWSRNSAEDKFWLKWLSEKPYTVLYVDGNHENFDMLYEYPVTQWHGGNVHALAPNVLHLMRGQVFDINGLKFFTMGGASSHDKEYRKEGISWWTRELPSQAEYDTALKTLKKHNYTVDYVITHCMPTNVQSAISPLYKVDALTTFLDEVDQKLTYKRWYSGHYHISKHIDMKHTVLYDEIQMIKLD